jgi:hypothetical protein
MSEQFKTSPEQLNKHLEDIHLSDALSDLKKDLESQFHTSPELLEKVQLLIKQNTSIEIAELKSSIEQSDLQESDKRNFSEIPDNSLQNFMNEVLLYRESVTASLDSLNSDIL